MKASSGTLFEQQTGATVEYVLVNPADNLTKVLAAPTGDPPFAAMQVDSLTEATLVENGLIDKVDHVAFPRSDLFTEAEATKENGPVFTLVPIVMASSPTKFTLLGFGLPTRSSSAHTCSSRWLRDWLGIQTASTRLRMDWAQGPCGRSST